MQSGIYYDATKLLNEMLDKGELRSYTKDYCKKLYICNDTLDIWVARIQEGYNEKYEQEDGKWLIERNDIDKNELYDYLREKFGNGATEITSRRMREDYINKLPIKDVLKAIIQLDDEKGLENYDSKECDSLEEAIDILDGGYGILELPEEKEVKREHEL